jgi:hypothetical protein
MLRRFFDSVPAAVLTALAWALVCLPTADAQSAPETGAGVSEAGSEGGSLRAGRYVVRPGDTLESLALRYLGSATRWREIWRLNEERVGDPNLLRPGWEIELPWRRLPDDSAVVSDLWNNVKGWRPPLRWTDAQRNDVLRDRDRLQTFADSSAELTFPDLSLLRITEESMVLLRTTSRLGTTVERDTVEIVEGQADLSGSALDPSRPGIQLVVGDATATPRPSEDGEVRTRVRKAESAAQLMVYSGASDLQASGSEIEVPQGMGSTAKEGEAPSPPEKLLDAPELRTPAAGARLATPRPSFAWDAIEGAAHYTLELCRDAACSQLERRISPLAENGWQPPADPPGAKLPVATLHWRITATSVSGLDGYPSETREMAVLTDEEDTTPPEIGFGVGEPRLAPRHNMNHYWILGPGARLEAIAEDGQSGLERWIPLLDGEEVDPETWQAGPWGVGEHREASFTAFDRADNRSTLEPIPFVFDDQPPVLTWGLEALGQHGTVSAPDAPLPALPDHHSLRRLEVRDPHVLWPWRKQKWQIEKDPRQLVIRPNRPVKVRVDGQDLVLTPERGLWVLSEDAICGSIYQFDYELDLQLEGRWPRKNSRLVLHVRAVDWVTNTVEGTLDIETTGRARRSGN